jgi:ElaA protein
MQVVVKQFHELTVDELYAILRLRAQVFVVEQDCVYQDLDDIDQEAWHVYIKDNDEVVGCLRVIDKGKRLDEVSIGRVVSLHRKRGIGRALMETGKAVAKEKLGVDTLDTQTQYSIRLYCYGTLGMTREWLLNDNITPARTAVQMMFNSMPVLLRKAFFDIQDTGGGDGTEHPVHRGHEPGRV